MAEIPAGGISVSKVHRKKKSIANLMPNYILCFAWSWNSFASFWASTFCESRTKEKPASLTLIKKLYGSQELPLESDSSWHISLASAMQTLS